MSQDTTGRPLPPPVPRTGINPTCHACGEAIDGGRVIWARRDGALRPLHPACVQPTPQVHGIVIR